MSGLPVNVIKDILSKDVAYIRFEQFCCDLFTEVDQRQYFSTSRSYDLGRDGRTLPVQGSIGYICCGTTGGGFDAKAEADLRRLLQFAQPAIIYFCSNREQSEAWLHEIERLIRLVASDVPDISAVGGQQLAEAAAKHVEVFERRYAAELLEYREFLLKEGLRSSAIEEAGMRIALATQFHEDAPALRSNLLRVSVLTVLADGTARTPFLIAKAVSDALHLPRIIDTSYFTETLHKLTRERLVTPHDAEYVVTQSGIAEYDSSFAHSERALRSGERIIRDAIEKLLGTALDSSFPALWRTIQDELAALFFASGLKLIHAISSLMGSEAQPAPRKTFSELLEGLRARIAASGVRGPRSEELAQAVVDLFMERDSEVFQWLTDLAIKYVGLCSLGLEPTAQDAVQKQLKNFDLIVDTDVVLSYLSQGERPHDAVVELLQRWRVFGGTVIVLPPVLEEAAYHAWISEFEYMRSWRSLEKYPQEVYRYTDNAFVRAFYSVVPPPHNPTRWHRFIREYRGSHNKDDSLIRDILHSDNFKVDSSAPLDTTFAERVRNKIYDIREIDDRDFVPPQIGDKIARDGRLVSCLKEVRSQTTDGRVTVILSSSPILQNAAMAFSAELGAPEPVWSIAGLMFLASLVPGVRFTMSTLRKCLFSEKENDSFQRLTKLAMQVIHHSQEFELGYSRRTTLEKALKREIASEAAARKIRTSDFTQELLNARTEETQKTLAEIIANSVDQIQSSRSEKLVDRLRERLRELGQNE